MFTGIIEEIGTISSVQKGEKSSRITVKAKKVLQQVALGDSISTNGVCLTVSKVLSQGFEADVMAETLRRSNLGSMAVGCKVNLERALRYEGRFGGHIVTGHIDGTGKIIALRREDNAVWVTVSTTEDILKYIVEKGSIAIDGISLTVAYVDDAVFKVSVIPHTGQETTLLDKAAGEAVNLECDVIGKYVEKLLQYTAPKEEKQHKTVGWDFLKSNGYL